MIASINGSSLGGWVEIAQQLADAGAAAIELNIYFVPGDLSATGAEVEQLHLDIVPRSGGRSTLPLAVKLSPFFSSPGNMALRLVEAGADGLVLFNRFLQPEVDVEALTVEAVGGAIHPVRGTPAAHLDRRPVQSHRRLAGGHLRRRGGGGR